MRLTPVLYKVTMRMIAVLYRWMAVLFGTFMLAGCTGTPQYRVTLQRNHDDGFLHTLWVQDGTGNVSSLEYYAYVSSHLLKPSEYRDDVIKLEWLDAGDEPVFFDLFRNGKRYLLIHDFGGSNYGPYHLRVIEFDADGWRQIYYGPTGEIPRLDDVNGDGRFEFRHFDDFSTPLATMNPCGVLVLAYSNGKLMPDRELNKKVPMTSEDLSALAEKYKKIIHEFGYASSDNGEDVKAYFVKETLIDLLYGGNWHQCDQVIQYLKYDPVSGEQLKTKILEEVQASPYYVFIMNLNSQ